MIYRLTPRRRKTVLVAIYSDASEYVIHRKEGAWWWRATAGSYPLSAAIENVMNAGGRVERRPV
jgi:hypothetical protein